MHHQITCVTAVEDDVKFQDVLKYHLSKFTNINLIGIYSDTVNARLHIEKLKPELVLLDINISGLDGPEFLALLDHRPKVIVISGHDEAYLNENYELEYVDFIQKPINKEKFKKAIGSL